MLSNKHFYNFIALVRQLMKDWSIPYTVVLIVLGISFGAISRQYAEVRV